MGIPPGAGVGVRSALPAAILALAAAAVPLPARGETDRTHAPPPPARAVAHAIDVRIDPASGRIAGTDRVTVERERGGGGLEFELREGLALTAIAVDGAPVEALARLPAAPRPGVWRYLLPLPATAGRGEVALSFEGVLREEVRAEGGLAFVAGDRVEATIGPAGAYLASGAAWFPLTDGPARHSVRATVPAGWTVATEGGVPAEAPSADGASVVVDVPAGIPTDGIWLQAGRWTVTRRAGPGGVSLGTYLSERNAAHADVLAAAVAAYLPRYTDLLGPYPHAKFDIVENFFTTGYGMPAATLLGGDVIARIGMVAAGAGGQVPPGYLDHELVHCWWGNGVLVDYASGNWCEALTTYCSNYLRREWEGAAEAAEHRRTTRARFAARVTGDRDYPLRRFTGKTEDFENDIGYGKGSMLFHAARRAVGDGPFFAALRDVVASHTGRRATWDDFRAAFEARGRRRLDALFDAFLDRTGAPLPRLVDVRAEEGPGGWSVSGAVVQGGDPWPLSVPLVVETTGEPVSVTVDLPGARAAFAVRTADLPLRVVLDPDSHCWRGFAEGEMPETLDRTLASGACAVAVPPGGAAGPLAAVVEAVAGRAGVLPATGGALPGGARSLLAAGIAGDGARPHPAVESLLRDPRCPVSLVAGGIAAGGRTFRGDDVAVLASFRAAVGDAGADLPVTLYLGVSEAALAAARRVFYYGADGVVVFKAGRPVLRLPPEGDASSRVPLLAARFPEVSAARAGALIADLAAMDGRLAGSGAGRAAAERLADVLAEEDGHRVIRQEVRFDVVDWDGSAAAAVADAPFADATPLCFSPPAPAWVAVPAEAPLHVAGDTTPEAFLTDVQRRLEARPGPVLVLGPGSPPAWLAPYLRFPSTEPAPAGAGPHPDPAIAVEGARARLLLPDFPVTAPVVYLGRDPARSALPSRVRAPLRTRTVVTENVLAVIEGADPALRGEAVLLGAHHDALGPGFPGIDDDASGVAAVREAGRALAASRRLLRRSVVLALFGAEEWGLRGSRAFASAPPAGLPRIVAALTLDTVGHRAARAVDVVGRSVHPGLAAVADRCLAAEGFSVGRDIDRFAFAWGSDHYALHAAGIPAVDLFSGDYATMHAPGETADHVDADKVARIARAAAAFAVAASRGEEAR